MTSFTDSMQNGTTNDTEYNVTIEELNRQHVLIRLPAIILVIVTMILGFIGNSLTIYVYGFRLKLSPTYLFVVMLACVDLIVCVIVSPLSIVQTVYSLMTPWDAICKIHMCLSVFTGLCNCGFLVAIAIDRYRKICLPMKAQITMTVAKIMTVCIFIFCAIQGSIVLLYYGSIRKPTKYPGIYSYSCSAKNYKKPNYYQLGFFSFYFLLTLFVFIVLVVLYTKVLRQMRVMWKKCVESQQNRNIIARVMYPDKTEQEWLNIPRTTGSDQLSSIVSVEVVELSITETSSKVSSDEISKLCTKTTPPVTAKLQETDSERRAREQSNRIQSTTITMMMISGVYIVTYLPCIAAMMVDALSKSKDTMSVTAASFYWLARHSFYINSGVNPIIYSCRNQNFIDEVKKLFGIKQK